MLVLLPSAAFREQPAAMMLSTHEISEGHQVRGQDGSWPRSQLE